MRLGMCHEPFDVADTQAAAKLEPDDPADHVGCKSMASKRNRFHELSAQTAAYATDARDMLSFV